MFGRMPKEVKSKFNEAMMRILDDMIAFGPDSPEYPSLMTQLERITNVRKVEPRRRLNYDDLPMVVGNIVVAVIIVAYEHKHVITTRAKDFLLRSR